jgi:soluble lytic murein transglycosylase
MESDNLRLLHVKRALLRRWINDDELSPEFVEWRKEQLLKLNDIDLLEIKIRHEIEQGNWQQVVFWIGQLPDEEKQSHRWRFWLARALSYQGDDDASQILLSQLLGERDFYGSAAAAILDKPIRYDVDVLGKQSKQLVRYQRSLRRIEELLARDKWTAARSEWHWLLRESDDEQRAALAYYAFDHGWSHFAILAAIKAQRWGALRVRFPIEYESTFKQLGKKLSIAPTTLMSIARQESALDKRARSYVGARGLMQLMPSTAKHTAKKFHLPLRSNQELYQPKTNINIASHYFRELLDRFDENRILAFAAYNAGPSRVNYWLKSSAGQQDVFQFIESIPYRETRGYVQNILMFETYYKQLLGESPELLTQSEATRSY